MKNAMMVMVTMMIATDLMRKLFSCLVDELLLDDDSRWVLRRGRTVEDGWTCV